MDEMTPGARRQHLRVIDGGRHRVARSLGPAQAPPPMAQVRVDPTAVAPPSLRRHALVPLAMLLCALAYYGAGWPIGGVVALACVLLLAQSWIAPWASTSRERLDRDLLTLTAKGSAADLPARFAKAWGFRLFGAPAEVEDRRGRALRAAGAAALAQQAYAASIEAFGGGAPLSVVNGYANAAFEAGDDAAAIEALRAVVEAAPQLTDARDRLAQAMARSGAGRTKRSSRPGRAKHR